MTSSAMVRLEAVEAARRRPGGSAAGTSSALSRTIPVQPRAAGSTCRWGLQGPGSRCDPRATWLRREGARWLYCTPTSLALLVTYSTLHKTHLIPRVAPNRPGSIPSSFSEVEGSPSIVRSSACRRGPKPGEK